MWIDPLLEWMARDDVQEVAKVIGVVVAVGGLAWRVVTWRLGGARVQVKAGNAFPAYAHEVGDLHAMVVARNTGRAAVTVTGWGYRLPDGGSVVVTRNLSWSTRLPHRLEPGAEASWFTPSDDLAKTIEERGVSYRRARAFVALGDGRTVFARRHGIGRK